MLESNWLLFILASLVLIVTPGQDMILVMSRSIAQGPGAGVVTAAGVSVGLVGHTLLATLGLGAILLTSEWLFLALKLVGATYLVYLGIQLLRTRSHDLPAVIGAPRSLWRPCSRQRSISKSKRCWLYQVPDPPIKRTCQRPLMSSVRPQTP